MQYICVVRVKELGPGDIKPSPVDSLPSTDRDRTQSTDLVLLRNANVSPTCLLATGFTQSHLGYTARPGCRRL